MNLPKVVLAARAVSAHLTTWMACPRVFVRGLSSPSCADALIPRIQNRRESENHKSLVLIHNFPGFVLFPGKIKFIISSFYRGGNGLREVERLA